MVVRIPITQPSYDAAQEYIGITNNLVGIVSGHEYKISQLIDLGYKDSQQEGSPYLHFDTEKELRDVCKEFDIDVWEHEVCAYCSSPIRGYATYGSKGIKCSNCDFEGK